MKDSVGMQRRRAGWCGQRPVLATDVAAVRSLCLLAVRAGRRSVPIRTLRRPARVTENLHAHARDDGARSSPVVMAMAAKGDGPGGRADRMQRRRGLADRRQGRQAGVADDLPASSGVRRARPCGKISRRRPNARGLRGAVVRVSDAPGATARRAQAGTTQDAWRRFFLGASLRHGGMASHAFARREDAPPPSCGASGARSSHARRGCGRTTPGGDEVIGRPGVLARRGRRPESASPTRASGAVPGADAVAIRGHLAEFRLHAAPVRRLGALTTDDRSAGMLRTPADWRDWMGLGALTTDDRGAGATDHPHAAATVAAVGEPVAPCAAAPGGAADGAMSAFFCRDDWTRTHEHSTLRTVHLLRNERLDLWEDL